MCISSPNSMPPWNFQSAQKYPAASQIYILTHQYMYMQPKLQNPYLQSVFRHTFKYKKKDKLDNGVGWNERQKINKRYRMNNKKEGEGTELGD